MIACLLISLSAYAGNLMNVGIQQLKAGEYERSVNTFTREIKRDPDNIEALLHRGFVYYYMRQLDKAELDYKTVIKLEPRVSQGYFNYGLVLAEKGLHKESIIQYKKAIKLNSTDDSAHYNLGNSYSNIGDLKNAVISYEMAVKLNPEHPNAKRNLLIAKAKLKTQALK